MGQGSVLLLGIFIQIVDFPPKNIHLHTYYTYFTIFMSIITIIVIITFKLEGKACFNLLLISNNVEHLIVFIDNYILKSRWIPSTF